MVGARDRLIVALDLSQESIASGADYLVVGRSVYRDPDPKAKVEEYVRAIMEGLEERFGRD